MPTLDEMMKRREEKMAERPQMFSDTDLKLRDNKTTTSKTIAVVHSLYSGMEGDPYLRYYITHPYPRVGKKGGKFTGQVYCPVESGDDENYDCVGCRSGAEKKDRFAIWFYVYKILYNTRVDKEQWPLEPWIDGENYFTETVNKVLYWETSAWKQSPLEDIAKFAKDLGDLRQMRFSLTATNTGLEKRYKMYPESVGTLSPIDPALYEASVKEIRPVIDILKESLTVTETVQASAGQPEVAAPVPTQPMPANVTPLPTPAFSAPPVPAATPAAPAIATQLPPFKAPEGSKKLF